MERKKIKLGDIVVRSKGGKEVGRIGKVVDEDLIKSRRQVKWYSHDKNTTWISFNSIELDSIPYEILYPTDEQRDQVTLKLPHPKYRKL